VPYPFLDLAMMLILLCYVIAAGKTLYILENCLAIVVLHFIR
jgi:hypothetical protein